MIAAVYRDGLAEVAHSRLDQPNGEYVTVDGCRCKADDALAFLDSLNRAPACLYLDKYIGHAECAFAFAVDLAHAAMRVSSNAAILEG